MHKPQDGKDRPSPSPAGEEERYARTVTLAEVGREGQERLLKSRLLIVGAGGLGSAALLYLAAAGVGQVTLVESDKVDASNLNRQILYTPADIGRSKAEVAAERIRLFHPRTAVDLQPFRLDAKAAAKLFATNRFDATLDCTDNFETRFTLAAEAWKAGMPLVSASAQRFGGQLLIQLRGEKNPCYRCLFGEYVLGDRDPAVSLPPPPSQTGVLGAVVGVMGSLQATETIKLLLGLKTSLIHNLLDYNALRSRFRSVERIKDPVCPVCGSPERITRI